MSIVQKLVIDPHCLRHAADARVISDRICEDARGSVRVTEYVLGPDRLKQVMLNGATVRVVKTRIALKA
ncbi:MAG: hypothetical protein ACI3XE_02045 [Eubacteriales bacterium]